MREPEKNYAKVKFILKIIDCSKFLSIIKVLLSATILGGNVVPFQNLFGTKCIYIIKFSMERIIFILI